MTACALMGLLVPGLTRLAAAADATELTAEQIEFFEKKIRPLLVIRCFECHGNGRTKGGLSLASSAGMLAGGESGAVIVPGQSETSLLMAAVRQNGDLQMPPDGKLSDTEIADLALWIEKGAYWPAATVIDGGGDAKGDAMRAPGRPITAEDRAFWSFRPVGNPAAPTVRDTAWPRDPIDAFVLAKLEAQGLKPAPTTDRRALIRRASFDLIGLPPTMEEVEAFVSDHRPDAFADVVDRLLASPRHGERWARHWLDVARYGEDQAHTFQARLYPNGFHYRDWVVKAFNDDLPYNRFLVEQIAGDLIDEIPADDRAKQRRLTALGFFALGPIYYADNTCAAKAALDELDDRVDTLARGVLGLTIACGRCHDHKFDPITQHDYYALAGVFAGTDYREAPLVPRSVVDDYNQAKERIGAQERAVGDYLQRESVRLAEGTGADLARYLAACWDLRYPPAGQKVETPAELAQREHLREFILLRWQRFLKAENKGRIPALDGWIARRLTRGTRAAQASRAAQIRVRPFVDRGQGRQHETAHPRQPGKNGRGSAEANAGDHLRRSAKAVRRRERPARVGARYRQPRKPAHGARDRQSPLAAPFRPRLSWYAQQFRSAGRTADAPRVARPFGAYTDRAGLVAQGVAPPDFALGHLPAVERARRGGFRGRSR